jgi:hypothetical protein
MLEVGTTRHSNPKMITCLLVQRGGHAAEFGCDRTKGVPQIHPDQGCNLVVTGPAGSQSAAQLRTYQLYEPPLERAVHILIC